MNNFNKNLDGVYICKHCSGSNITLADNMEEILNEYENRCIKTFSLILSEEDCKLIQVNFDKLKIALKSRTLICNNCGCEEEIQMTMIKGIVDYLNGEITKAYENHNTVKAHELRRVLIMAKELAKKEIKILPLLQSPTLWVFDEYKKDLEEVIKDG